MLRPWPHVDKILTFEMNIKLVSYVWSNALKIMFDYISLLVPAYPLTLPYLDPGRRAKINLNFYFDTTF